MPVFHCQKAGFHTFEYYQITLRVFEKERMQNMAVYGYDRTSTKEQHLDRGILEIKKVLPGTTNGTH